MFTRSITALSIFAALVSPFAAQAQGLNAPVVEQPAAAASAPAWAAPTRQLTLEQLNYRGVKEAEIQVYPSAGGIYASTSGEWAPKEFTMKALGIPGNKMKFTPGENWSSEFFWIRPMDGIKGKSYGTWTVIGEESITVPAGTFVATKISAKTDFMFFNGASGGSATYTFWYVPELGYFVRMDYKYLGSSMHDYSRWLVTIKD